VGVNVQQGRTASGHAIAERLLDTIFVGQVTRAHQVDDQVAASHLLAVDHDEVIKVVLVVGVHRLEGGVKVRVVRQGQSIHERSFRVGTRLEAALTPVVLVKKRR